MLNLKEAKRKIEAIVGAGLDISQLREPVATRDFFETAADNSRREAEAVLLGMRRLERKKALFALRRLEDGSYGKCAACAGDIPEKRLEADPAAFLCLECEEKLERGELPDFSEFADADKPQPTLLVVVYVRGGGCTVFYGRGRRP